MLKENGFCTISIIGKSNNTSCWNIYNPKTKDKCLKKKKKKKIEPQKVIGVLYANF
jgi:hypothetical protein